jgi:uncharacterized protein (DUF924 family)
MSDEKHASWVEEVLHFWFEELEPAAWFSGAAELDDVIWDRFGDLRQDLKASPPDPADLDGRGHVAAVIVFDQFSRNMFRRSPEAFATDPLARAITHGALARRWDRQLSSQQRQFLAMPLMHSERIADQRMSLAYFTRLGARYGGPFARAHYRMIARFGRYPHRNAVLGRRSTPAEIAAIAAGNHW